MKQCNFIFLLIVIATCSAMAQVTFSHRYHFDTPANYLTSIVATDSCYYATGLYADTIPFFQQGSFFVKFDLDGVPLFVKKIIHPDKSYEIRRPTLTDMWDGTFVVTANSFDPVMKGMLIKYDHNGDTIWTREYLNPHYPDQEWILPFSMDRMTGGGFVMAFVAEKNFGEPDIYLVRTNANGEPLWSKTYGDVKVDLPGSVLSNFFGEITVGGQRSNINTNVENYIMQHRFFKTDSLGTVTWTYTSPPSAGLMDNVNGMVLLDDGGLIVASGVGTEIDRPSTNDVWFDKNIFKLSESNGIEWEVIFEEPELSGNAKTTSLIEISDGSGFVMTGTEHEPEPEPGVDFTIRGWVGKISPDGESVWVRQYAHLTDFANRHNIAQIKECPDGGFIICGESRDFYAADIPQQGWLLKLDAHGCLIPGCHLLDATGEAGMPELELAIYPNPTSDYLNFQLRGGNVGRTASFRIVDLQGRVVRTFESGTPGATHIVPVWDWGAGVYFLQCLGDGEIMLSEKFIKQ